METKKIILSCFLILTSFLMYGQPSKRYLKSIGAHKNGVSIGEPVIYNKGRTNIGFLNRFNAEFSAEFYFSQDTLCQKDFTEIILNDSSNLRSKKFNLTIIGITQNNTIPIDSVIQPSDTGFHQLELKVRLGRRRKKYLGGFYVLPKPQYTGPDTINVCQESNSFYFKPKVEQCNGCGFNFPNSATLSDSVFLTIYKDSLYSFDIFNNEGCIRNQTVWFDYHPTPTMLSNSSSLTICNEDTITIGYQTNGIVQWLSHPSFQGPSVPVSPSQSTIYYAQASSAAGCESRIDTIMVNVNQLPNIALQDSNFICVGLTEQLIPIITGSGGYQYTWSNGALTKDITISDEDADYLLTVTDTNGCVETHIVHNRKIDYTLDAGFNDSICFGESYDLLPYQGTYSSTQWSIADSILSNNLNYTVSPLQTTTYLLTTTNDSACQKVDSVTIAVDSLSQLSFSITDLNDLKIGDTLNFKNLNIENFHSYTWYLDGAIFPTQGDSASWIPVFQGDYTLSLEGRNSLDCPNQLDSLFTVRGVLPRDYERIIYPNPTLGKFKYNVYSNSVEMIVISIVDAVGRTVFSQQKQAVKGMNTYEFDLSNVEAGKYYLNIESSSEIFKAQRPWVIKL